MSELPPQVLAAKQWCAEARILLKKGKVATQQDKGDIDARVKAIVDELTKLNTALKSQSPEIAQQFITRFATIAKNLKEASAKKDGALVDGEALALGELKREIRIAVMKLTGKAEKAVEREQKKLDTLQNDPGDVLGSANLHNFTTAYDPLASRIRTALAWTDVSTPVKNAVTLLRDADKKVGDAKTAGNLGEALALVTSTGLEGLLDAAEKVKGVFETAKSAWTKAALDLQPVLAWDPTALETPIAAVHQVVKTAHDSGAQQAAAHEYEAAVGILTTTDALTKAAAAATAKPLSEHYATERATAEKDREALRKHPQKAHIDDEWTQSRSHLDRANRRANDLKYAEARAEITEVARLVAEGKAAADDFATFLLAYAKTRAIVVTMADAFGDKTYWEGKRDALENARTDADTNRHYNAATTKAAQVLQSLRSSLQNWYVTGMQTKVQEIRTIAGTRAGALAFIQPDLDEIEQIRLRIDADIRAEKWTAALWEGQQHANDVAGRAKKYVTRRIEFDDEHKPVADEVEKLRAEPMLAGKLTSISLELRQAEFYASRSSMRIERGIEVLTRLSTECKAMADTLKLAKDYATKRKAADDELVRLEKAPAAKALASALTAIRGVLAQATAAAEDDGQVDPDWSAALGFLLTATKDLAAADALAKQLAAAVAAQASAGEADDAAKVGIQLAALQQRAKAAGERAHADRVTEELKRAGTALTTADTKAKATDVGAARTALTQAAGELLTAETVQLHHAACTTRHAAIEKRRKEIADPGKIQASVDAVATALKEATDRMTARDYEAATAALHRADALATAAAKAAEDRKEFDRVDGEVTTLHTAMTAGGAKDAVGKVLAEARRHAAELAFVPANRALERARSQIETADIAALAAANPADASILTKAQAIVDRGDAKLLDKLVASLPADTGLDLVKQLAKKRFGITLDVELGSGPNAAQEALATTKKMWQMFAKVPEDSRGNPSLKTLKRLKPGEAGGFYRSSEDLVVMHGRPAMVDQTFGKNLKNAAGDDQLPANIDDIYLPVNDDPIDYFDFATLHEVGHAVDDRLGFMSKRAGNATFGGWRTYGGDLRDIAVAVATEHRYDADFVEQMLHRKSPTPPPKPNNRTQSDWDSSRRKVETWYQTATNEKVWWDNAGSDSIEIDGTIYHEAYTNNWVSYPKAERSRGITGYQFRAPGEWFAELYASFYAGKLKKSHPAARWLTELTR